MNKNIFQVIIEKQGVSDDNYKVVSINCKEGSFVEKGQLILCIETSKASIDIDAPIDGYIFYDIQEDDEVTVSQVIAIISESETFDKAWFTSSNNDNEKEGLKIRQNALDLNISKPAQKLIDLNNIDITLFKGKSFVTKEDVEIYINTQKKASLSDISINEKSVFVLGGGGHSKMCIEILNQAGIYEIVGIIDSILPINSTVLGIPIIGHDDIVEELVNKGIKNSVLGIGAVSNHSVRRKLFLDLKEKGLFIPNIIHPSASIEPSVQLGEGNQIMQGAIIGSSVKIGNNCIINSGSIISHDTVIGDNVHITPGSIIGGSVVINNDTLVGMGATIFLGVEIGKNVVVNNGVNVFDDIPDNEVVKNK